VTWRVRRALAAAALCGASAAGVLAPLTQAAPGQRATGTRSVKKGARCARRPARRRHHVRRCRVKRQRVSKRAPLSASRPSLLVALVPGVMAGQAASAATPEAPAPVATTIVPAPEEVQAPSQPAPSEPPSVPHVQVSAVEYSFSLSRTTVPAGKVVLEFVNDGQDEHNLNVGAPEEGSPIGSFPSMPSKAVADLQLEMRPGAYTLFCSLPTHESKGMKATLTVE
jgi:plastocyanin